MSGQLVTQVRSNLKPSLSALRLDR